MVATAPTDSALTGKTLGLAVAQATTLIGLDSHAISVEACSSRGPSSYQMVGLAEAAVKESRVRVATALARLGLFVDEYAITINLAPADLRKQGAGLDVAIAAALLGALGQFPPSALSDVLLLGELSLQGELRPIRGVLPQVEGARSRGVRKAIVAPGNAREAGIVRDVEVLVASTLEELRDHFRGKRRLPRATRTPFEPSVDEVGTSDLSEVRGQAGARRALEVAAAGGHNLFELCLQTRFATDNRHVSRHNLLVLWPQTRKRFELGFTSPWQVLRRWWKSGVGAGRSDGGYLSSRLCPTNATESSSRVRVGTPV